MIRIRTAIPVAAALALALTGTLAGPATATEPGGAPVTHDDNEHVPAGAAWTQHYFPSSDGSNVEIDR